MEEELNVINVKNKKNVAALLMVTLYIFSSPLPLPNIMYVANSCKNNISQNLKSLIGKCWLALNFVWDISYQ
jgi:hypothetical protein